MVMEDDWDLHAVVRGCAAVTSTITTTSATATAVATSSSSSNNSTTGSSPVSSSSGSFGYSMFPIFEPKGLNSSIAQLNELCKPKFFFPKSHLLPNSFQVQSASASSPLSSSSFYSSSSALKSAQTQTQQKQHHLSNNKHSHAGSLTTPRSKRRKNQPKKVCQVPAEAVSSDIWAWRKYGQKPIKGSPYPRGYYRCSTSKACLARKQVERNRSDPTMFIVTYTAEHNHPAPTHRNSLAGSTRQKPPTHAAATGDSDKTPTKPISPATSGVEGELASQVTTTRSESKDEDEENEIGLSDMELSDDFFEGLDELTGSPAPPHAATGDCFADPFSACIEFPAWVANEASSTAGSI